MINLLIVDDDIATVEVIRDSISWSKMDIDNVSTAFNVFDAKKILLEQKIDIIISDIEMPQETGLGLLKWIRDEKLECEFLFLTCHENFSYATNAINYDAAAYLTKPFDINIMELNIQKIVSKLKQKRNLKKNSEYGIWVEKNLRVMKLDFWKAVFESELLDDTHIKLEIERRHLNIDFYKKYCFVYSKLSNNDIDIERYGKSVFEFILEGFHSEILTEKVENESVIKFYSTDTLSLSIITICDDEKRVELREKCEHLIEVYNQYFKSTITCCISNAYEITKLSNARQNMKKLFDYNVGCFGKVYLENELKLPDNNEIQILDLEKVVSFVENKEKPNLLRYLKQIFDELSANNKLNLHSLYLIKQEIVQVVYADLMKQGIQATKLFYDELSIEMSDHALDSTVDMIRWVNYLLEKTFAYEDEIAKSVTIVDKINDYIHKHYSENIGRSEIARDFYLTSEYLSKLYKKKTGINLKDYINEYRIEKAKELLRAGEQNISEVAIKVGFDNFSYFSTLFKKLTGISPKDYKK
ncbi:two-component system response regulator YesN [Lachnotalea glycerini]|uniref:Stage 0 sporulation protein A homolog n=1 Tax=Lachnotalea glycerini TaxID=1763509 RepID=A0A318EX95_9FIRM|nr:response regulator [Lachnotalea glycerini]PXV95867.1 two-component system response regulator YesN [Lachnotalea glycerini]